MCSDCIKHIVMGGDMSACGYHLAELNIEGNHQLLIRAVWEQIALVRQNDIDQKLHELEDDEATRQGL